MSGGWDGGGGDEGREWDVCGVGEGGGGWSESEGIELREEILIPE